MTSFNRPKAFQTISIFLLFLLIAPSFLAQMFEITEIPDWTNLKDTTIESSINKYDVQSGYYYTNLDMVYNHIYKTDFMNIRHKILTNSGIDAVSQINITFDSSYQKVQFHSFKIIRDGSEINRTASIDFSVINQENDLDQNIFNGVMAVHALLEDIRIDDEIEYAYSIIGTNPLLGEHFHSIYNLQDVNPIDRVSLKIIVSSETDIHYKTNNEVDIKVKAIENKKTKELDVEAFNISAVELEESMTSSIYPFNYLEISTFKNFEALQEWAIDIFHFENSSETQSTFDRVTNADLSLSANATSLLDFVQNKVRYKAVHSGIGSLKPNPPDEVMSKRFGDCKDKSVLLIDLLHQLGVEEAYPALVNTYSGKGLNNYLAGCGMFDHVIVNCKIDDVIYWIDPTQYGQGGDISQRLSYDYGYAFVIDGKSNELVKMNVADNYSSTEMIEEFNFEKIDGDGSVMVTTIYKGKKADYFRNVMEVYSKRDISKILKENYSRLYNQVSENDPLTIEDDYENNIVTLVENYKITNPWEPYEDEQFKGHILSYEPLNIYNYISPTSCDEKVYDLELDIYSNFIQKTTFKLPYGTDYHENNFETRNKAYTLVKNQIKVGLNEVELFIAFKIETDILAAEEYSKICEDINKDSKSFQLVLFKSKFH